MIGLFDDLVRDFPIRCWSKTRFLDWPPCHWEKVRVIETLAGPIPSDTMKMRFRFPDGRSLRFHLLTKVDCWFCDTIVKTTMTAAAAARTNVNNPIRLRCWMR